MLSKERFLTTHVGSLPRSQVVVDFLFAKENGADYDRDGFAACMRREVEQTLTRQLQAGVDWVSDGETSKISYATYVKRTVSAGSPATARATPRPI